MVHGANMGPIWARQDPGGPHVGPMDFAIWDTCEYGREYLIFTYADLHYHIAHVGHRKLVLGPVRVRILEYLAMSTNKVHVIVFSWFGFPFCTCQRCEIKINQSMKTQCSSTASTSTEYEYPSPAIYLTKTLY